MLRDRRLRRSHLAPQLGIFLIQGFLADSFNERDNRVIEGLNGGRYFFTVLGSHGLGLFYILAKGFGAISWHAVL